MPFALRPINDFSSPAIALTFSWRETERSWHIRHIPGLIAAILLALLALWYLVATTYFIFHDQLVASLISHQIDVQYSYEDQIAALQTQLDRETSQGLLDRRTLATKVRDLASKSKSLEAHAEQLDSLVRGFENGKFLSPANAVTLSAGPATNPPPPQRMLSQPPQAELLTQSGASEDRADLVSDGRGLQLLVSFDRIEARQAEGISLLRAPLLRKVARLRTALLEAGVPASRWTSAKPEYVGGPLVPLPEGTRTETFDQSLALLRDALSQETILYRVVDSVPLRRPLDSPLQITSPFGARVDPFLGQAAMHTGVDLMEAYGAPVKATASGTVGTAASEGGYGNMVEIDHGDGIVTRYAHLSAVTVVSGQKVSSGMIVGRVGSTGRATGPHLHYETRINGVAVDPVRFLKAGASLYPGGDGKRG